MRQPTDLELKLANAIAAALRATSMELRKSANVLPNLGVTPALALAMALMQNSDIHVLDDDPARDE